jgi:2-dehydro-3-deoxygluconokinase
LPANPFGQQAVNYLRSQGVDISEVCWAEGERMGLLFLETGAGPRPTRVYYDRAESAASHMTPDDLPADLIQQARWLHLTGITAALSATCQQTVEAALELAQASSTTVSLDVNYRALLWPNDQAAQVLAPLCQAADVVFIAARDARTVFGQVGEAVAICQSLQHKWGGVVICSDGANGVYGCEGEEVYFSAAFPVNPIIDRIGAGDALASGVICRLLEGAPLSEAQRFGAALAALKLTIPGDVALVTRQEVENLLNQARNSLQR